MKKVLYALAVVVAVLACKREDKAGSKDVVATALPPFRCPRKLLWSGFTVAFLAEYHYLLSPTG